MKAKGFKIQGSDLEKIIYKTKSVMSFEYSNYENLKNYIYKCYNNFIDGKKNERKYDMNYLSSNVTKEIDKIISSI